MTPEMCPTWFEGFNLAFHTVFFLVTLWISILGYNVFKFFGKEEHKFLSLGWATLALSYIANVVADATSMFSGSPFVMKISTMLFAYLFLAGLMILLFAHLRIEQPAVRGLLLILVFSVVTVFNHPLAGVQGLMFYILTAALMLFIVAQLFRRYQLTCHRTTLMVALGFSLLTLGQLVMVFSMMNGFFYVLSATITLAGFLMIAARKVVVRV